MNTRQMVIIDGVEYSGPGHWSERAVTIFAKHYCNVVGGKKETTVEQACKRITTAIFPEADLKASQLFDLLINQAVSFNSPVWYNLGVTSNPMLSACYILDVEDSLSSIYQAGTDMGYIFKSGGGAGLNVSKLRREGAPLSLGGTASGPVSFMYGWDAQAGVIKSGGHHRRAAVMMIMNSTHPDIDSFINVKVFEERKARCLADAGLISRGIGERSVAYQNMNLSVLMMPETLNDGGKRRDMFMKIAKATWECGDPGVFFYPAMQRHNWTGIPFVSTNPCGEVIFIPNSACNLATVNLSKYVNSDRVVLNSGLNQAVDLLVEAQNRLILLSSYPTKKIQENSLIYRPIGIGFTDLGSVLFRNVLRYGSESAPIVSDITNLIYIFAYNKSKELALKAKHHFPAKSGSARELLNAQLTVAAPEGTRSLTMDADSTGIEPVLSLKYTKKMVGGGEEVIVNRALLDGLKNLGYGKNTIDAIISGKSLTEAGVSAEHRRIFQTALGDKDNPPLRWKDHLDVMAAAQSNITGGISKTINVPNSTSVEEIAEIFEVAYQLELKSVTVYRDGSKYTQPLTTDKPVEVQKTQVQVPVAVGASDNRRRLPRDRQALTHRFEVGGTKGYVTVGYYPDGKIGEVFCTIAKDGSTLSGLTDAFCTLLSFALQYGIPLDSLVERFLGTKFEPHGFTDNKDIPSTTSIIDYLFQWLAQQSSSTLKKVVEEVKVEGTVNDGKATWKHTGDVCSACGGLLMVTGRCKTCTGCGVTSGCGG